MSIEVDPELDYTWGVPRTNPSQTSKNKEGIRLKTLRQAMGMPMREFAKEFNVAVGSISQWESGEHAIPGPVLKLIEIYEQKLEKRK